MWPSNKIRGASGSSGTRRSCHDDVRRRGDRRGRARCERRVPPRGPWRSNRRDRTVRCRGRTHRPFERDRPRVLHQRVPRVGRTRLDRDVPGLRAAHGPVVGVPRDRPARAPPTRGRGDRTRGRATPERPGHPYRPARTPTGRGRMAGLRSRRDRDRGLRARRRLRRPRAHDPGDARTRPRARRRDALRTRHGDRAGGYGVDAHDERGRYGQRRTRPDRRRTLVAGTRRDGRRGAAAHGRTPHRRDLRVERRRPRARPTATCRTATTSDPRATSCSSSVRSTPNPRSIRTISTSGWARTRRRSSALGWSSALLPCCTRRRAAGGQACTT